MEVICEGIYFNETSIESDKEPSQELTIDKYDLSRSSGFIIARFKFDIDTASKLMFKVELDGVKDNKYGTNLPVMETSGDYDTTLFRWDGSAKHNKVGRHVIKVTSGIIPRVGDNRVTWDKVEVQSEATFIVNLVDKKRE